MKTRCPNCQTTFRVTPEQLKARAGKVRCGQCQTVFNALDSLLDETIASTPSLPYTPPPPAPQTPVTEEPFVAEDSPPSETPPYSVRPEPVEGLPLQIGALQGASTSSARARRIDPHAPSLEPTFSEPMFADPTLANPVVVEPTLAEPTLAEPTLAEPAFSEPAFAEPQLTESAAKALGKATGLIMPRETTEIPGYSKWTEGVMAASVSSAPEKAARWPFTVAAALLAVALAGQLVFRFRSEIAITLPSLRPALELLSHALDAEIPLPRHVELVSIETSDLQTDPTRGNLLVLNATLRNRANYGQAYPSLELSLTDTQDAAIARRVFAPADYLPAKTSAGQPFAANSDVAVRLWIEAREIAAAGYRLYVFYP